MKLLFLYFVWNDMASTTLKWLYELQHEILVSSSSISLCKTLWKMASLWNWKWGDYPVGQSDLRMIKTNQSEKRSDLPHFSKWGSDLSHSKMRQKIRLSKWDRSCCWTVSMYWSVLNWRKVRNQCTAYALHELALGIRNFFETEKSVNIRPVQV